MASGSGIKFGTDGWRAIIAEDYTYANVRICAQAMADYLKQESKASAGLVIGYDTRFASEGFAAAAAEVAGANGLPVLLSDRAIPTPVVSFAVINEKAGGGVVITASHNPGTYNGFKIKPDYGGSASPEVVAAVEERIEWVYANNAVKRQPLQTLIDRGQVRLFDPTDAYLARVNELVDLTEVRNAGLKVVADAMHGAGAGYFARLLAGGSTQVIGLRQERNPAFPGIAPEPITPNLAVSMRAIKDQVADVGLATDGDADRIGAIDEQGNFINQHQVYALLLLYLLEIRERRGPAVRSVTSSVMADRLGEIYDVPIYETPVGFKYIGPKMTATRAIMGGEESGGFGFDGHIPERDAIVSGAFLLDLMVKLKRPMSSVIEYLQDKVGTFAYDRVDIHFEADQRQAIMERVASSQPVAIDGSKVVRVYSEVDGYPIDGFKFCAEDGTWLLIRFSGTEPLLRIYTETTARDRVQRILAEGRKIAGV
jgi:alpha-D-glucose phosphate-specific phosphoglucomutase